jgi:hypothetical protein
MKYFAEQLFFGLLVEIISLVISYRFKDNFRVAFGIFFIGTAIAGFVAFSPFFKPDNPQPTPISTPIVVIVHETQTRQPTYTPYPTFTSVPESTATTRPNPSVTPKPTITSLPSQNIDFLFFDEFDTDTTKNYSYRGSIIAKLRQYNKRMQPTPQARF